MRLLRGSAPAFINRLRVAEGDSAFRLTADAFQVSLDGLCARVSRPETAEVCSVRLAQQIARFHRLPQILQHRRQIRLPDGDGGVSGLDVFSSEASALRTRESLVSSSRALAS
jgi:hypothetical protein